jgi:hypothetical protein
MSDVLLNPVTVVTGGGGKIPRVFRFLGNIILHPYLAAIVFCLQDHFCHQLAFDPAASSGICRFYRQRRAYPCG